MLKIEPTEDRILVKPIEGKDMSEGGIVIPDTAKELPCQGEVLAVGPGKLTDHGVMIPMVREVGDVVIYSKYGGTKVKGNGGQDLLILRQGDAMAVLREEE